MPGNNWQGSKNSVDKYSNYYNTIMSVESFNGYILSNQYADGAQFNNLQNTLIKQASDGQSWFSQVATENMSTVLRQILMYESQVFVLLSQLVQTQRQMVTAQAMTNTLLIAVNQNNETQLVASAQNVRPSL